eukprot:CAMPEP_0203717028 /NCGR_PEP_ID=MMETSP0092-20131115/1607_1 /ASSEMBLY_ACC=CAM_ASM_001090 /TAXON_ID=426623 /ORGANISM="Chaetoceros affinis, Strain CCMP159" /LENGTH=488 /DNA_ID=CAMNT_0050595749 /DNA_START=29 /DNA_END=1495 /DNA_ORIENTATION=+
MSIQYDTTLDAYLEKLGRNPSLLAIAPKVCGSLSMVSSCYVVQDILKSPRKRSQSTYHRVMLGLSITDILSSIIGNILSTWPIPSGYHLYAAGSVGTCDAVGFFNTLTIFATPVYYCSLTTYYLVQLKYNWLDRDIRAIEKWLHIVPWSLGLVAAVIGLATKSYGPNPSTCWLTQAYPIGCDEPSSLYDCERGNPLIFKILSSSCGLIVTFSITYVIVAMSIVYMHMYNLEQKALMYSFVSFIRSKQKERKRSRRVMVQGILYTVVLVFINLFLLVGVLLIALANKYVVIILNMSNLFLHPLQGFFNALIYAIPTFQRLHKRLSDKRKEQKRKSGLNRSTKETTRSSDLFLLLQRGNDGIRGEKDPYETVKEVSTEEEEEEGVPSLDPTDLVLVGIQKLREEENQGHVPRPNSSSLTREEIISIATTIQQEQKRGSSNFSYSLEDFCFEETSSIDDDDDYLSLRFLTEDQRENSLMRIYQDCDEDNSV